MNKTTFDKIYENYLAEIAGLDFESIKDQLGIKVENDEAVIDFFGSSYRVSPKGIKDPSGKRPSHAISVVLCKYMLLCPEKDTTEKDWVSYKDFRDAAPFVGGFVNNSQVPIAEKFSGRLGMLEKAGKMLGGCSPDIDLTYDLSMKFDALPKVPILMLFNDEDDEFPAQTSLLFEKRAEKYLDMECLAIIGWSLYELLIEITENSKGTLI